MNGEDLTREELLLEIGRLRERLSSLENARDESRFMRQAVDAQTDTFFLFDPASGKPILWNRAFREISGYSDEEIGAMKAPDSWYSEADLANAAEVVQRTSAGEQSTVELNLITRSGKTIPTEYKTAVIDDHIGAPYILSIGRDLTARKAQEELLVKERKQYHDFLNNLDAGVVAHAPDSSILYCNNKSMELLGLTMDQMRGKTAMDPQWRFLNEDGTNMALEDYPVIRTLKTLSRLEHYVCGIRGKDEAPVTWVVCNSLPVFNDAGALDHVLISFFDITSRVQAEEREKTLSENLARAQRLESLGLLAGGVAHDLNNMLGPIVGLPDFIRRDVEALAVDASAKQDILESLRMIKASGQRSAKIVKDLLGLSRSGHSELVPTVLNALPYISGLGAEFELMCKSNPGITFSHVVPDDAIVVMGVGEDLTRILHNILLNAIQSIPDTGTVRIRAKTTTLAADYHGYENIPAGDYAVVSVADSGKGIARQDLGHVFEPFFSRTKKTEHAGTGLGLSVVHRLVKDHKGYIDVKSELDAGTTIYLYLPLRKGLPAEPHPKEPLERGCGGAESILIVDDEPGQRFLAARILSRLGYVVQEVENGRKAVALFSEHVHKDSEVSPFHLVLLDMVMEEDFDGLDTLRGLLELYPEQKVIIVSGHARDNRAEATHPLGLPWLSKPYLMVDLEKIVRKTLDAPSRCLKPA